MATRKLFSASIYTNEGSNKELFVKFVLRVADCFGTLPVPGSDKTLFFSMWGEFAKLWVEQLKSSKFKKVKTVEKSSTEYVVALQANDNEPEFDKDCRQMLMETAALSWTRGYSSAEDGTFLKRRVKEGATSKLLKQIGFWYVPNHDLYGIKTMEINALKEYDVIRPTFRATEPDEEIEEEL